MKTNQMNILILSSPWPMMMSINTMNMTMNMIMFMNKNLIQQTMLMLMMNLMVFKMWINNSMMEKTMMGKMSNYNDMSMKPMIYLIIMTESMFFTSMFYLNFSMSYFNNYMFNFKYNLNIMKLNFILSFTNLMILLASSMTLMISTSMNMNKKNKSIMYMKLTMMLALYFLSMQTLEYSTMNFNMSNSIFFSNFYMLTLFHMIHVAMGTMMMMMLKQMKMKTMIKNQTKFKMMCWYWHFVDMIWVMIFVMMYTK